MHRAAKVHSLLLHAAVLLGICQAHVSQCANAADAQPPDPRQCLYTLRLEDEKAAAKPLTLYLSCRDGVFQHGWIALTPQTYLPHKVTTSDMSLAGASLGGIVQITIVPEPGSGDAARPVTCVSKIQTTVRDSTVSGTFTDGPGFLDEFSVQDAPVRGRITGTLRARPGPLPPEAPDAAYLPREDAPGDGAYTLTLAKALHGGADLFLHLRTRSGAVTQAWATAPTLGNTPHLVDVSKVRLADGALRGKASASVGFVRYDYDLDIPAAGAEFVGTYAGSYGATRAPEATGVLSGRCEARPEEKGALVAELDLGKPLQGGNEAQRRTYLTLTLRDGRAVSAKFRAAQVDAWDAEVGKMDLAFAGGKLAGSIPITIQTKRSPVIAGEHVLVFDAQVTSTLVAGQTRTLFGGREVARGSFSGRLAVPDAPVPGPANAAYVLTLEKAVAGTGTLTVYLDRRDGAFAAAGAVVGVAGWPHAVDATGLQLEGAALKGELKVQVNPHGWSGQDRPVACVYQLDAALREGAFTGTFKGGPVPQQAHGAVAGRYETWAEARRREALTPGHDYPFWRGPYGNGASTPCDREMVDALPQARLVWRSEAVTPDSWLWSGQSRAIPTGGYCTPIVSAGRMYVAYYVPAGKPLQEILPPKPGAKTKPECDPQPGGTMPLAADDVILCVDARTGETLWKDTFRLAGANFNASRAGPVMNVTAAGGRVFVIGSLGQVYALDAVTGAPDWQVPVGPEVERLRTVLETCRKERKFPRFNLDFCSSPVVVDGVVVCNDNRKGLIGLDAETGKVLWGPVPECIRTTSCPVKWTHQGKNYVIAAYKKAVCIEPRSGKVLWEVTDAANSEGTPAVDENHMVLGSPSLACWKITPESATRAWVLTGYSNHVTSPAILKGHVYAFRGDATLCVEIETGKLAGWVQFPSVRSCSSFSAFNNRIIRPDCYARFMYYDANPQGFKQLGDFWLVSHSECTSTAVLDGRWFFRTKDALVCYDLRKPLPK